MIIPPLHSWTYEAYFQELFQCSCWLVKLSLSFLGMFLLNYYLWLWVLFSCISCLIYIWMLITMKLTIWFWLLDYFICLWIISSSHIIIWDQHNPFKACLNALLEHARTPYSLRLFKPSAKVIPLWTLPDESFITGICLLWLVGTWTILRFCECWKLFCL